MKCPKCHYISFDSPDRCRHCGYDFALLAVEPGPVDAPLRDLSATDGPLPDLSLHGEGTRQVEASRDRGGPAVDLPLFNEPVPGLDDTPLISSPSPPRAPLSVRRATPDPAHLPRPGRPKVPRQGPPSRPGPQPPAPPTPAPPAVPWLLEEVAEPVSPHEATPPPSVPGVHSAHGDGRRDGDPGAGQDASGGARLGALGVDLALLAALDLSVVHFTLAVVGYPWGRLAELPLLPLVTFCLMLDAGYFILLTGASGQTLGKMLTGTRVVGADGGRVPMTQAALRAALAPLSLVTLGLGYLPALAGRDRRALHDRLSRTRVVRG